MKCCGRFLPVICLPVTRPGYSLLLTHSAVTRYFPLAQVPLHFREDAAAVFLAIQTHTPCQTLPLPVSAPEVPGIKLDVMLSLEHPAYLDDEPGLLIGAYEEGGRESPGPYSPGCPRCLFEPHPVAGRASFFATIRNNLQVTQQT